MHIQLSVPSKTFLVGEYIALFGGPCLVAATEPRFEMIFKLGGTGKMGGLHPESPAGRWMLQNPEVFETVDIEFVDPFNGSGGLGASGAQFVMVYMFCELARKRFVEGLQDVNVEQLWSDFRSLYTAGTDWLPSGADVVSQFVGGLSEFEWKPHFKVKKYKWPFEDLGFVILKTGSKVNTHEHLRDMSELDIEPLKDWSKRAIESLLEEDPMQFVRAVSAFYDEQVKQGLVCEPTKKLVQNLNQSESVVAVKGCGALGADTLFVVCEKAKRASVGALGKVVGLEMIASDETLTSGLDLRVQFKFNRQQQAVAAHKTSIEKSNKDMGPESELSL